jgi:hypothetical protein
MKDEAVGSDLTLRWPTLPFLCEFRRDNFQKPVGVLSGHLIYVHFLREFYASANVVPTKFAPVHFRASLFGIRFVLNHMSRLDDQFAGSRGQFDFIGFEPRQSHIQFEIGFVFDKFSRRPGKLPFRRDPVIEIVADAFLTVSEKLICPLADAICELIDYRLI